MAFVAACSSLSEEECRAGDWFAIGQEDGRNGRLPSFVEAHTRACADQGIAPDLRDWERGRQDGLALYCTPSRAYGVGRRGRDLSPVCPASKQPSLERANARGLEWYRLTQRILDLEDEIRELNTELRSLEAGEEGRAFSIRSDRQFLRLRILGLEAERRRVATPRV